MLAGAGAVKGRRMKNRLKHYASAVLILGMLWGLTGCKDFFKSIGFQMDDQTFE
jgi:hypothetical protein